MQSKPGFGTAFLLGIFLVTLSVAAPLRAAGGIEVLLQPERPKQGEVVLVTAVVEPGRWTEVDGVFQGRPLSFRPGRTLGSWWALAGVPIDSPRTVKLSLCARSEAGPGASPSTLRIDRSLSVASRQVSEENLRVPSRMVTPPREVLERIAREKKKVKAALRSLETASWYGSFQPPVLAGISSPYGRRRFFNGVPKGRHWGVDLRAMTGTPVHSTQEGVVAFVGNLYFTGGTVIVDHGDGLHSLYFHLSRMDVREGQPLRRGEVLGAVGASGRVTGAHLHWEMRLDSLRLDPFSFCRLALDPVAD